MSIIHMTGKNGRELKRFFIEGGDAERMRGALWDYCVAHNNSPLSRGFADGHGSAYTFYGGIEETHDLKVEYRGAKIFFTVYSDGMKFVIRFWRYNKRGKTIFELDSALPVDDGFTTVPDDTARELTKNKLVPLLEKVGL